MKTASSKLSNIHAHIPYLQLPSRIEVILKKKINPEIFFSGDAFDRIIWEELSASMKLIHSENLQCTIHAPFMDLNPGSVDPLIRNASRKRVEETFKAAEIVKPRVIVFHPGYDDLRYGNNRYDWLKHSIDFWSSFIESAENTGCKIAMENIFEKETSTLKALIEGVGSPIFGNCFDSGHWNMFSPVSLEDWFAELGSYIFESHLHDNHGVNDEHLPIGEGEIDFDKIFSLLKSYAPDAVWTIEAHTAERLDRAMLNIRKYL